MRFTFKNNPNSTFTAIDTRNDQEVGHLSLFDNFVTLIVIDDQPFGSNGHILHRDLDNRTVPEIKAWANEILEKEFP